MPKPKNKGLGRGLEAIFSDNALPETEHRGDPASPHAVPLSEIDVNADQPRKSFPAASLGELADSIARDGLLQPVLVRRTPADRYEIIAGERRFRAAKLAGLTEIPVIVLDADDATAARVALVENLQREDLNPLEEAAAYEALMDRYGLTQEQVAEQVGKSRSAVANALRLLELPEGVRTLLLSGFLTAGHARTLLGLKDKSAIVPTALQCVEKEMTVRALEETVQRMNRKKPDKPKAEKPEADYIRSIEGRFTGRTGRRCKIVNTSRSRSIQFEFRDNSDLEAICKLLCGDDFFDEF
ncbi:MAG: ParB/RepB/Spo0J family partition protein [Ruminococcaceae bacterium]|jgi:ParB family chromosome partitioning protein|nr:ParB/RepB/Spo0J family partition protein [Oscillospiraceae bacterium]